MAESVGDVLDAARQRDLLDDRRRIGSRGEKDRVLAGVGGNVGLDVRLVRSPVLVELVAVEPDDLVALRRDDAGAGDGLPLARRLRRIVAHVPAGEVDRIVAGVVELHPVKPLEAGLRAQGHAVLRHHLVDGHIGLHVGRDGTSLRRQRHVLRGDERHRSGVDRIACGWRERNRDDGPLLERVGSVRVWRHLKPGDRHLADRHVVNRWHRQHHGLGLFRLHRSREGRDIAGSNI